MTDRQHCKIICLSNVFDDQYLEQRGEQVDRCLGIVKRRNLFLCLKKASGREILILSSPPKAAYRKQPRWLPSLSSRFGPFRQLFCRNWDVPKLRIPLSWFFYAWHVARYTDDGDLIVIDNYELIYLIAAWFTRLRRKVHFILDYEDGKHLIDHGIWRVLSGFAEFIGRPLLRAAIIAQPSLAGRLPSIPCELVPGFVEMNEIPAPRPEMCVRFLYSGSLDFPRGIDLLMEAISFLPGEGWRLEITGDGPMAEAVRKFAQKWHARVRFRGPVAEEKYLATLSTCHVGLNCQRSSDPISRVTFPSKVFTYLTAGLLVISSRASEVPAVCGSACLYYDEDNSRALSRLMNEVITNYQPCSERVNLTSARQRYSLQATTSRLQSLLTRSQLI